jgi:hypothetical protein
MRIRILFVSLFITLNLLAKDPDPVAVNGILNLREISDPDNFIVNLNGEWEFYWKKMLHPHDFNAVKVIPDYYGKVPSYWTDYPQESVKTEKFGYATYRLTVLLPRGLKNPLGIDLPVFDSSYDLYIDDKYIGGNGITGKSADESKPEYRRNFFRIIPESDTITIILIVSNYYHRRGGFWLPAKLGSFLVVQKRMANSWAGDWSVISLLLGFSLFFLFFFMINPKERIMGFFSMATIGLAIRPLFTSHYLILNFFELDWEWIVRIEYMGLFIILIGWVWVVQSIYPSKLFRFFSLVMTFLFGIVFILTIFLPVRLFSYATLLFYPAMIILMIYAITKSLIGLINKNNIDYAYFSAFTLLIYAGIHDIRVSLGKEDTTSSYFLTYFVVLFVFIQATLLLYKWVSAFREKEKLQNDLAFINRNLELLVNERTMELKTRNEEIEKQNSMIALQNKKLSETIHLKNKIFSVIAHDLRSPVVNILYA